MSSKLLLGLKYLIRGLFWIGVIVFVGPWLLLLLIAEGAKRLMDWAI